MKVRIGYGLGTRSVTNDGARYDALVDALEALGFDSLWLSEKVTDACLDPVVAMAYAAARTSRLEFGTSVLVLPSELRRAGRLGDGRLPSFCTPYDVRAGRAEIERVATEHGRTIDPEHFGALVAYGTDGIPDAVTDLLARRRPGVDPGDVVVPDLRSLVGHLERLVEAGASKFVAVPLAEPDDWGDHLAEMAETVLPLTT